MQYSQPFCGTGFSNSYGQTPYNVGFPQFQQPLSYPEIIGEGEVVSIVFPDGSMHLYFIPLNKRFPSYNCHPNNNPFAVYNNNSMGAYYVRGISNPITPATFRQQCHKMHTGQYSRPCYISDCNFNTPSPGFQLKFHNDGWTSTTDLQYFFPCKRQYEGFCRAPATTCASVQVDIPVKECVISHQPEVICAKPCLCPKGEETYCSGCESLDECHMCKQSSNKINKCKESEQKRNKREKKNRNDIECSCSKVRTTDKSIVTVADQSCNCATDNEQNTQTCSQRVHTAALMFPKVTPSVSMNDYTTELWFPKSSQSGKSMKSKSSDKILGVCETGSSATCCCSGTEDGD